MALNAPNDEKKRPPIEFSVGVQSVLAKELEKALAKSEDITLSELLESLLLVGLLAWAQSLSDKKEREKLEALLGESNIELHVVERSDEADEELGDPTESFRIGWAQAMNGEALTEEEFWKAVAEDE